MIAKMNMKSIDFRDPEDCIFWLETALEKETDKYAKSPVMRDGAHDYVNANGWGYVVTAYFLTKSSACFGA